MKDRVMHVKVKVRSEFVDQELLDQELLDQELLDQELLDQELLDQELLSRVTKYLFSQHFPAFRSLDIGVDEGIVTLTGEVHSYYEKQIAMNSCHHVVGVSSLVDEIVVIASMESFKG